MQIDTCLLIAERSEDRLTVSFEVVVVWGRVLAGAIVDGPSLARQVQAIYKPDIVTSTDLCGTSFEPLSSPLRRSLYYTQYLHTSPDRTGAKKDADPHGPFGCSKTPPGRCKSYSSNRHSWALSHLPRALRQSDSLRRHREIPHSTTNGFCGSKITKTHYV